MSTFEIVSYTSDTSAPEIKLDLQAGSRAADYMGHMGKGGQLAIQHISNWASEIVLSGDVKEAINAFFHFAKQKYFFEDQDSIWITLRFVTSNDRHKIPRPHHDGRYWSKELDEGREQFKAGTVFCGPGTLFWSTKGMSEEKVKQVQHIVSTEQLEKARELGVEAAPLHHSIRQWTADKMEELEVPCVQVNKGECVRWVVGDKERAAIHSEPDMSDMPEGRLL